jgi:hypothetical protein
MANTETLLSFTTAFPEAFADPEAARPALKTSPKQTVSNNPRIQALMTLASEFPEAFVDPDLPVAPVAIASEVTAQPEQQVLAEASAVPLFSESLPAGYELSLNRTVSTFTWGQIEAHLSYSAAGLASLWLVVGKSGTEIQSLCEAICRLTNLLLAHQVPVTEITRQLRGIRGADSEGLGPHRILGLADLIGKVLQEAPAILSSSVVAPAPIAEVQTIATPVQVPVVAEAVSHTVDSRNETAQLKIGGELLSQSLLNLSDNNHRMSLCPECGSELQAMNGCSGGACQVCGFSSCS